MKLKILFRFFLLGVAGFPENPQKTSKNQSFSTIISIVLFSGKSNQSEPSIQVASF
jgi:hypothetical protein